MKKIIVFAILISCFACQKLEVSKSPDLTNEKIININPAFDAKAFAELQNTLKVEEFESPLTKKKLEDIMTFYQSVPQKVKKLGYENLYANKIQHNLICNMVLSKNLLEQDSKIVTYYAGEYAKLEPKHTMVAGALVDYLEQNQLPVPTVLRQKGENFNKTAYLKVIEDISEMQK